MFNKIIAVALSFSMIVCAAPRLSAAEPKKEAAKAESAVKEAAEPQAVKASTPTAKSNAAAAAKAAAAAAAEAKANEQKFEELNSAIAGLNFKIEYLNGRNNQLGKDVDE